MPILYNQTMILCAWSGLGLGLSAFMLNLGFGAMFAEILVTAG